MSDLVVISLEAWDGIWRRNQHLVAGLLRSDPELRVLFVEPAADPLHSVRSRNRPRLGSGLRPGPVLSEVEPDRLWLYQPTKWLPRRLDRRLDERQAGQVERAAARIGFAAPMLWVNAPAGAHVLARTRWRALYDITDDWLAAERTRATHDRLVAEEQFLLSACDEIVVCSEHLYRSKAGPHLTLIPNAVDVEAYRASHARPPDLPLGRTAVYVGTLHTDRLDVTLCESVCRGLAGDATLVLVGPVALVDGARRRLQDAGAVLLGAKSYQDVPAYLQHADVLVVPHLVNDFTESLDPIKVYEYRAAGRPIISTPVAGFRGLVHAQVTTASGTKFTEEIKQSLTTPRAHDPEPLTEIPSWKQRVGAMHAVVRRLEAQERL